MNITKSGYSMTAQCPKMYWLYRFRPDEAAEDPMRDFNMEQGKRVGELARGIFGEYADMTAYRDGCPDTVEMIVSTAEEVRKGTPVICEAAFQHRNMYCAVDILRKEGAGYAIYEVKSTAKALKCHAGDIAFQKYVLGKCGINVTGTYLICLNRHYTLGDGLNIRELFRISDMSDAVSGIMPDVSGRIAAAEMLMHEKEPDIDIGMQCRKPYPCGFWEYCTRDIPRPSVFELYGMPFRQKTGHYREGRTGYAELLAFADIQNPVQRRQMEHHSEDREPYVDRKGIREFLGTFTYPVYFLDFETMQEAVPRFRGAKPYMQIPFQYSLHIAEEGGKLTHREFLAEPDGDPRRALAERLCGDIPDNVCIVAYNKAFECGRLRELAEMYPDLAPRLLNMEAGMKDLLVPFKTGMYYKKEMGGSFSIKSVLPALFPDDPSLDYHSLEGVHNGSEAMNLFPKLQHMSAAERETAEKNLLRYCKLDTYAMVRIWERLKEAAEEVNV